MFETSSDPVLREMARKNIPMTRKAYLKLKYPDGMPPWTLDLEAELPRMFQGERGTMGG